jgi:PAS domain S-box-containing protein
MKSFAVQASISVENAYLVRGVIESEEKYRLISENTSDLISVTTLDGTYTYVSQSHRQYGYKPERLLGRSGLDLVHPDDRTWMKELMREYSMKKAIKLGSGEFAPIMRSLEYRFITQAGEWRYLVSTANLIFDSLGNPISFLVVSHDITDRKRAEREAKSHQEQLIQAAKMASLGTLVSGVAHEINNPISYIMLNAPIFQKVWNDISPILDKHCRNNGDFSIANMSYSQLSERIPLLLSGVVDGTRRVATIVNDLKEFSRQSPPELTDMVDINNEVKKAVGLLTNLIKKSTDHVSVSNGPDIPLFKGNAQRVEQVIINLIVNACQSLADNTKEVSISTFYDSESDSVVIKIQDQGEGMTSDVLKRIRDPFFTMKRESGGTGLGLAISDRIVTEHGGSIVFESTVGHGTTVRVSFPVKTKVTEKRGV